jgi:hypothetical protein
MNRNANHSKYDFRFNNKEYNGRKRRNRIIKKKGERKEVKESEEDKNKSSKERNKERTVDLDAPCCSDKLSICSLPFRNDTF